MSISPPMTWPPPRYRTAAVAPFMAIIMMGIMAMTRISTLMVARVSSSLECLNLVFS